MRKIILSVVLVIAICVVSFSTAFALNVESPLSDDSEVATETTAEVLTDEETEPAAEPATEAKDQSEKVKESKPLPVKVSFKKSKFKKYEGDKFNLTAKVNIKEYKVKYTSKNKKVATITKAGKVKCKKEGTAKIVASCNGVKDTCKVIVSEKGNSIESSKMKSVASKIGKQTNYAYASSKIMCSAYSFAYAYYQVTGNYRSAGSFWTGAGCTWNGGTYHRMGSSSAMLKLIKSELDKNKACVGLMRWGRSSTHYVTFYGYTGKGDKLSDFKIIDPWDAKLRTGASYGYSYSGYHVATVNK